MPVYAVRIGRRPGIYATWAECQRQVTGVSGADYKKCHSVAEAAAFVGPGPAGGRGLEGKGGQGRPRPGPKGGPGPSSGPGPVGLQGVQKSSAQKWTTSLKRPTSTLIEGLTTDLTLAETIPESKKSSAPTPPVSVTTVDSTLVEGSTDDVIVYCDGACSSNGQAGARGGAGVFFAPGHPDNVSRPLRSADPDRPQEVVPGRPPTNQVAEVWAAILALEVVLRKQPRPTSLLVRSDSTYVVKGMNEWRHTWKRTGRWLRDASDKGIANRGWWHWLDRLDTEAQAGGMRVTFEWVKGHADNVGNNAADALATAAAAESKDL